MRLCISEFLSSGKLESITRKCVRNHLESQLGVKYKVHFDKKWLKGTLEEEIEAQEKAAAAAAAAEAAAARAAEGGEEGSSPDDSEMED